ncbi:hypothetical protein [Nonomuraea sp. NPDC005650]|uniref:tetratricopeptide repeat protein n=1 Tax=Nonomuraea sp. NPDC005650 TaxID=3157045 RepID=UPI00339E166E
MALDDDVPRRQAGRLLRDQVETAETVTMETLAESSAEVLRAYEGLAPDASATGLALWAEARLRAYTWGELNQSWWWDNQEPFPGLAESDTAGRAVADDAVRAARRALELDPQDNLAAFSLAMTLEHLGDRTGAVAAYLEALRLDPWDEGAATRVAALGEPEPGPVPEIRCRHTHGFFLLRLEALISNNGDMETWSWLLTDPADVRTVADGLIADMWWGVANADWEDELPQDDRLSLEIHAPGEKVAEHEVFPALRRSPDGVIHVDWSRLPLPDRLPAPLPASRPVRTGGVTYFLGFNPEVPDSYPTDSGDYLDRI